MEQKINKIRFLYLEDEKNDFSDYMSIFHTVFTQLGINNYVDPIFPDFEEMEKLISAYKTYKKTKGKYTPKPEKIIEKIKNEIRPERKDVIYFIDVNWKSGIDNDFGMKFMDDFFEDIPQKEIILLTNYKLEDKSEFEDYMHLPKDRGESFEANLRNKIRTLSVYNNFSKEEKEPDSPDDPEKPGGIKPEDTAL